MAPEPVQQLCRLTAAEYRAAMESWTSRIVGSSRGQLLTLMARQNAAITEARLKRLDEEAGGAIWNGPKEMQMLARRLIRFLIVFLHPRSTDDILSLNGHHNKLLRTARRLAGRGVTEAVLLLNIWSESQERFKARVAHPIDLMQIMVGLMPERIPASTTLLDLYPQIGPALYEKEGSRSWPRLAH